MSNDKVREQFEAWALSCNQMIDKANGVYLVRSVDCLWVAWRASREALVIDLPETIGTYAHPESDREWVLDPDDVRKSIEAAGVKVKS